MAFFLILLSIINGCETDKYSNLDNNHFLVNKIDVKDEKRCTYLLTQDDLDIKYILVDRCDKFKLGQILTLKGDK